MTDTLQARIDSLIYPLHESAADSAVMHMKAPIWDLWVRSGARVQSGSLFDIAEVLGLKARCSVAGSRRNMIHQQHGKHAQAATTLTKARRISRDLMSARRVEKALEAPLPVG